MKRKISYYLNKKRIIIILLALFVTIAFSIKLDIVTNNDISEISNRTNYFTKLILKFYYSIEKDIFKSLLLFLLLIIFFKKSFFSNNNKEIGLKIYKVILSVMFASFMVFGYSYMKINSWDMIFLNTFQLFKAIIEFVGYYIIYRAILNFLFDKTFMNIKINESTNKLYNFIFIKHSFIIPLLIILICWIPYLIAYYPGMLMQDSANQIKQFYGYDVPKNSATNSVNLIDPSVKITNHHPVVHTYILGICMQIGKMIGNDNIGVFIYTFLQVIMFSSTFAYIINFMKKLIVPNFVRILTLVIFSLLPIIPIYAIDITKDIPFTCFVLIYITKIYDILKYSDEDKYRLKKYLNIGILGILIALFRNNGILVILMSLPFLAIVDKNNRKGYIITTIAILILYEIFIVIILPALKISPVSIREALSVPFQQTARYVKEHGNKVTIEEKNVINKVLEYDTIAKVYNPIHSDAVKNTYVKNATNSDLIEYFKVWFKQFLKYPTTYIQATINNTYGYFYPETEVYSYTTPYIIDSETTLNKTGEFNYGYIKELRNIRETIDIVSKIILKLPGISWIINIAFNTWIIMIILMYLLYIKKCRYIIYLTPFISIVLVNILSPVNAYFRYVIPYIFGMPLTIAIFIDILKNTDNKILKKEI